MTGYELRERAIQTLSLLPIALLAAALTCPATDIEPPWEDAPRNVPADGAGGGGGGDGGGETDGASSDEDDTEPPGPPELVPSVCMGAERRAGGVCSVAGARSAAIRWSTDRISTGSVRCTDDRGRSIRIDTSSAALQHRAVSAPLEPATLYECSIVAAGGNEGEAATLATVDVETTAAVPWIVVTEVLANPRGPEPTQEFVEIVNLGDEPVSMDGWTLKDEGDRASVLHGDATLEPGAVALLVPDGYDPRGAGDPPAAAGALLIPVGAYLATSGLRNSGEHVYLVDPDGVVVSTYPDALGGLSDGISAVRVPPESPEDDPLAWIASEAGGPTPGKI